jgi:hypothetical protein
LDEACDEIYIVCGHYDTVRKCPGADDNAAGTAAVLSAAHVLSKYRFNHTIRFIAFDSEEYGHLGSISYVADVYGDNIVAVLNADMMGYAKTKDGERKVRVYYNEESEWLLEFTTQVSHLYNMRVVPSGYSTRSDHASFWVAGYDAIFYSEYEFNPYYHSSGDTIENMNPSYATNVSQLIIATLAELSELSENTPPNPPEIRGPIHGKEGQEYEYVLRACDPHNQQVFYYVDWGDNSSTGWIGPYKSGEEALVSHSWSEGTYTIKARAKDSYGAVSNWTTLEVEIPYIYIPPILRLGSPINTHSWTVFASRAVSLNACSLQSILNSFR